MRIGLLSDTHGFLDESLFRHFAECDEIWHAGDFGSPAVLAALSAFKPTRGVYGNIDGPELQAELPRHLHFECAGLRVFLTHIGGYPGRYDPHARKEIAANHPGLFLCGHSHILRVMRDPDFDLIHLNPGACGHQGFHAQRTALRFSIEAGQLSALELIQLGVKGK